MSILLSEFMQGERKASVYKDKDGYVVNMFEGDELIEARTIENHTEDYVEEAAENWVLKVIR